MIISTIELLYCQRKHGIFGCQEYAPTIVRRRDTRESAQLDLLAVWHEYLPDIITGAIGTQKSCYSHIRELCWSSLLWF